MTNTATVNPVIDIKQMKKDVKEKQKANSSSWVEDSKNVIIGISLVLIFISISYSTVIILKGTNDIVSHIMIIPQSIFALYLLISSFVKSRR